MSVELLDNLLAAILNRFGFVAVKVDFADGLLKLRKRRSGIIIRRAVFFEELARDLIDQVVSSLSCQDQRHEQLQRIGEVERELGVGVSIFEPLDDLCLPGLDRTDTGL